MGRAAHSLAWSCDVIALLTAIAVGLPAGGWYPKNREALESMLKAVKPGDIATFDWVSDDYPIHVVFPSRRLLPVRTRLFIDAMVAAFDAGLASVGSVRAR